jgi:hypothetical protein
LQTLQFLSTLTTVEPSEPCHSGSYITSYLIVSALHFNRIFSFCKTERELAKK